MANFKTTLDATVLFSVTKSCLLMWMAQEGLFRPQWTEMIEDEALRNLEKKYDNRARKGGESRISDMRNAIDEPLIQNFEHLIDQIVLTKDPDDRHVVAAAYHTGAELIITENLPDFPEDELAPYGVKAINTDHFLCDLYDINPDKVVGAVKKYRINFKNPPLDKDYILKLLVRNKLSSFADLVKDHDI